MKGKQRTDEEGGKRFSTPIEPAKQSSVFRSRMKQDEHTNYWYRLSDFSFRSFAAAQLAVEIF